MSQLSYVRSRINSLRRKFSLEISHNRIRTVAEDFCADSYTAAMDHKPLPDAHTFVRKVVDAGYRLPTFGAVHRYLRECATDKVLPRVEHILGALLPWATLRGLVALTADGPPVPVPQGA